MIHNNQRNTIRYADCRQLSHRLFFQTALIRDIFIQHIVGIHKHLLLAHVVIALQEKGGNEVINQKQRTDQCRKA